MTKSLRALIYAVAAFLAAVLAQYLGVQNESISAQFNAMAVLAAAAAVCGFLLTTRIRWIGRIHGKALRIVLFGLMVVLIAHAILGPLMESWERIFGSRSYPISLHGILNAFAGSLLFLVMGFHITLPFGVAASVIDHMILLRIQDEER